MDSLEVFAWITGFAAAVAGVRYLLHAAGKFVRYVRNILEKLERLSDLATYELRHTGGSTIKDVVARLPAIEAKLTAVETKLDAHIEKRDTP